MPNLFNTLGYQIYSWSNENNEPIHVHVSKRKPNAHATKFRLTNDGGCILASNVAKLVTKISDVITAQYDYICQSWMKYFDTKTIKFYV